MPCPPSQQLEALLRAQLDPREEAELSAHLETCLSCRQRLEASAGGAILIPPRDPEDPLVGTEPSPALARVMDHLRQIQPEPPWNKKEKAPLSSPAASDDPGSHREPLASISSKSGEHPAPAPTRPRLSNFWRGRLAGAVCCMLLGCLWLLLDAEPLDLRLRALSYDLPFRLRGPIRPQEVLLVSMDAPLQRQLNPERPDQWSRAVHAQLLRKAMALGAEMVVFDITFAQARNDSAADQEFAAALGAASRKVVLGVALDEREESGILRSVPILPLPAFENVAAWGLAALETNSDGRVRQHYLAPHSSHPSLAWKAVDLLGRAPSEPLRPRWMNYYGARSILPSINYDRFLEQAETNLLTGRILFVGWNPAQPDDEDEYATPFTRNPEETVPGLQIHATAFLNLFRGEWLEELATPWQYLLIIGLGAGFGMGLQRLRPPLMWLCSVAGFFLVLLGACSLVWFKYRWFPWLIVGVVQIPCALFWSLLAQRRRSSSFNLARADAPASLSHPPAARANEQRRLPEIPDHVPLRCVGRGAYGEVWLARDLIGSFHAVKVVYRSTFTQDEPFEREFRGMQKFTPISRLHSGWVHILHVGRNEAQGYFYYIMELGDDETTGQKIDPQRYIPKSLAGELRQQGRLPLEGCLTIGMALADALEHLHRHGLVHRDIKPSNVIFVRDAPKFTDIGLVTEMSSRREVSWIGTEGYMAPEGPGTPAADVFGLGKLLFEIATGRDRAAFPKMHTALSDTHLGWHWQQFEKIILKACEKDPARRYTRAAEVSQHLSELCKAITVTPPSGPGGTADNSPAF